MEQKLEKEKSELEKCEEHYESRLEDCQMLLELENLDERDCPIIYAKHRDELGELSDYGLSMDFADYGNGEGDKFFRYQFSWGGPQEEVRIYSDGRIEFWYLDWGTGEHVDGSDFSDFIEYVTGQSVESISQKVAEFEETGIEPKL